MLTEITQPFCKRCITEEEQNKDCIEPAAMLPWEYDITLRYTFEIFSLM